MLKISKLQLKLNLFYILPILTGLWFSVYFILPESGGGLPVLLAFLFITAFFLLNWATSRIIFRPLTELNGKMEKFAERALSWEIHLQGKKDGLGELGNQLNRMAEAIRKKTQKLSEDLAESQALLGGMGDGVLILDFQGRVQKMNAVMEGISSRSSLSNVGKHYLEVFRDPELNELIQTTLAEKKGQRRTLALLGQPGKFFHVQSSFVRYPENGGEGTIMVFRDVSDLKRLERVRQEFVANVSHELRTPLTTIRGYVEALRDGHLEIPSPAEQFLTVIERHTQRMEKIVSDLLLLSDIESSERILRKYPLSFAELIPSAIEALQPMAEVKKQTIKVIISKDLPALRGDGQMIHQVLINLLTNAIKYTEAGGQITVEVRSGDGGVEVAVSDTGIGIPSAEIPRIFERFYRVDKGRSRELGGTGLGLSIVKHIVEAHGGLVNVESSPGQGSRFSFFLPLS